MRHPTWQLFNSHCLSSTFSTNSGEADAESRVSDLEDLEDDLSDEELWHRSLWSPILSVGTHSCGCEAKEQSWLDVVGHGTYMLTQLNDAAGIAKEMRRP